MLTNSSEVVQVPKAYFLAVILGHHHRVVHFSRVIHLIEFFGLVDVKWFDDNFCTSTLLIALRRSTNLLLLRVAIHIFPLM